MNEETIDDIQITEAKSVFFRVRKSSEKDGQIASVFERHSVNPGTDTSGLPQQIQDLCNNLWTPEVLENFKSLTTKF